MNGILALCCMVFVVVAALAVAIAAELSGGKADAVQLETFGILAIALQFLRC